MNTTTRSNVLPESLKGFYDESTYSLQQDYERDNYRFGLVSDILSFLAIMAMLIFGGFALTDGFVRTYTDSPILLALFFFGILAFVSDLLGIPLEVYHTFVIEERYGFNKTTPKTFVIDKLKGWLLGAVIGLSLIHI